MEKDIIYKIEIKQIVYSFSWELVFYIVKYTCVLFEPKRITTPQITLGIRIKCCCFEKKVQRVKYTCVLQMLV